MFHEGCITNWVNMSATCPICRYKLNNQHQAIWFCIIFYSPTNSVRNLQSQSKTKWWWMCSSMCLIELLMKIISRSDDFFIPGQNIHDFLEGLHWLEHSVFEHGGELVLDLCQQHNNVEGVQLQIGTHVLWETEFVDIQDFAFIETL